jgi:hypothetical protein
MEEGTAISAEIDVDEEGVASLQVEQYYRTHRREQSYLPWG